MELRCIGQGGKERVDLVDHEGSLSRARLYQSEAGEPPQRIADGVP